MKEIKNDTVFATKSAGIVRSTVCAIRSIIDGIDNTKHGLKFIFLTFQRPDSVSTAT